VSTDDTTGISELFSDNKHEVYGQTFDRTGTEYPKMKIALPSLYAGRSWFFPVADIVRPTVFVKCEALNFAGSIKIKPAMRMIKDLEESGRLTRGGTLIESSSGNLGIAVAMIAASKGYRFICVTDRNASVESVKTMKAVGAHVILVDRRDPNGGYLGSRIALINSMCAADPSMVWINQYANPSNALAHYDTTAPEILAEFPELDYLFIGVGTTGTLMGCARYFKEYSSRTRIVAVDASGSVTFGGAPGPRRIPGIGTSRRPELVDESLLDDIVYVAELDTIRMCRTLASRGLLLGASTGSVLAGIQSYVGNLKPEHAVVTIMPDLGSKYLDTVYSDEWVTSHYGVLDGDLGARISERK
jgi:N-(2-amino-2-carboxyethyl)-L-glutamate synthase